MASSSGCSSCRSSSSSCNSPMQATKPPRDTRQSLQLTERRARNADSKSIVEWRLWTQAKIWQLNIVCDKGMRSSCDQSHQASLELTASHFGKPASSGEQDNNQVNGLHVQDLHNTGDLVHDQTACNFMLIIAKQDLVNRNRNADTRAPDEAHDQFRRSPLEHQHQSKKLRCFCQETQDN